MPNLSFSMKKNPSPHKTMQNPTSGNALKSLLLLLCFPLLFPAISQAATITSTGSGKWLDPTKWSTGTVPTSADDVIIAAGHLIQGEQFHAATFLYCNSLTINTLGGLLLLQSNFTVEGPTIVNGGFMLDSDGVGTNYFKGLFTNNTGGVVNFSAVTNIGRNLFENGIVNNGSAFDIQGCTFQTNNQILGGTSPISFSLPVNIADGIILTNTNWAGTTIESTSNLVGLGAGAVYRNEGLTYYEGNNSPMNLGSLDGSFLGNTFAYSRDAFLQKVRAATYDTLLIIPDPANSNFFRQMQGDVVVNSRLQIEPNTQFETEGFNLTVPGDVLLKGTLRDDVPGGINSINEVKFFGGELSGNGANFGTTLINAVDLSLGDGTFGEGTITVSGLTNIPVGRTLTVNSEQGVKSYGPLSIAASGMFDVTVNLNGTNIIFNGTTTNNGTINLQKGTYTYNSPLVNTGTWNTLATNAIVIFNSDFENNGTVSTEFSEYRFGGTILGTNPMTITGSIYVLAGQTVVNQLDGLTVNAILNGLDAGAIFENQGLVSYNPSTNTIPMATGTLDTDFAGNTFRYTRAGAQEIKGGTYHHLNLLNSGGVTLNSGDVQVQGDLTITNGQTGTNILRMTGGNVQSISGGGSLSSLTIDKSANDVTVATGFTLSNALTFVGGRLLTNSNIVTLENTAVLTETPSAYLYGKVQTTRNVGSGSSSTFGGMGLTLIAAPGKPLSNTLVVRTNNAALTSGFITRFFDISPTNNAGRDATMVFSYTDLDLGLIAESNLRLYESVGGGAQVDMGGLLDPIANTLTLTGINSFATWSAGDPAAFPVELISFEAAPEYQDVLLSWTTASEINNDRFEIERSLDGVAFSKVGSIDGVGTTTATQQYNYRDQQALDLDANVLYYRLRQIDLDGSFHLTNVVAVSTLRDELVGLSAYPVPFQEEVNVRMVLKEDSPIRVQLLDIQGKVLSEERLQGRKGVNPYSLPAGDLSSGVYMIRVVTAQSSTFVRVVKE